MPSTTLNEGGQHLAFAKRQRQLTPFRFGLSVIASMATQEVPSIASLHRDFNALWDMESTYKVFYQQSAKASCAEFFRFSLGEVMGNLTRKVLGFETGQAFSDFKRLVIQDGSSLLRTQTETPSETLTSRQLPVLDPQVIRGLGPDQALALLSLGGYSIDDVLDLHAVLLPTV